MKTTASIETKRTALWTAIEQSPWLLVSQSMFGTRRYRERTVEAMTEPEIDAALAALRDPAPLALVTPSPIGDLVRCACGRQTLPIFAPLDAAGKPRSCQIAFTDEDLAVPGCAPDERSAEIIARRNTMRRIKPSIQALKARYPLSARIGCACGRATRVGSSNFLSLNDPTVATIPPDTAFPLTATACWLAIDENGLTIAGCAPDTRTRDILRRAGRPLTDDPRTTVELEPRPTARVAPEAIDTLNAVTNDEPEIDDSQIALF